MNPPLVSIAMPFYNSARTIAASIRSILRQSYENWELLLCDDGSTDAGRAVASSFDDPRIVVWGDRRRLELGARLNECIERAGGAYIARMDADDIAYPQRLARQVRFLQECPAVDLTGGWAVLFTDAGTPVGKRADPSGHAGIARRPLYSFKLIHPTFMGKASWFRRYYYRADALRCEDHDLLYRAYNDSRYANLPEIVLGYRQGSIDLRKRLRSRWMWSRCAGSYLNRAGRWRVGAVEVMKGCRDVLAVAARADTAWLRSRYGALNEEELREWQQVWNSVSCTR
ncbi:MAG: glycosyltransferase family A protein [Bryobacteraceae bacterium]|jgi:glycosyltransferase involved in cell wall biosynthesis